MRKNNQMSRSSVAGKKQLPRLLPLAALFMATASLSAQAIDIGNGLELNNGYLRGGVYGASAGMNRSGYQLGGDAQHYRLGNEGDEVFEVLITETVNADNGVKWKLGYMPQIYNASNGSTASAYNTQQAYMEMTGMDMAPEAKFWAGQRRLRIQDVHILDYFFLDYGMNYGAGMTDLNLGFAKLGVGVFNGGSDANHNSVANNARRVNVDVSEIKTNEGGVLRLLTTVVSGTFKYGSPGGMLSLSHNQSNFIVSGLTNSLFIQTATGHANLQGQFQGLGDTASGGTDQPGVSTTRIADSIEWQKGNFGGQAVVSIQNWSNQETGVATTVGPTGVLTTGDGVNNKDISLGGRVSYALTNNFKLLVEAATTSRQPDGYAKETLNKITFAPTLAAARGFWARPELRFYVTRAQWNTAAAQANATLNATPLGGTALAGRTSVTLVGVQADTWF
jgi:maltoporin